MAFILQMATLGLCIGLIVVLVNWARCELDSYWYDECDDWEAFLWIRLAYGDSVLQCLISIVSASQIF